MSETINGQGTTETRSAIATGDVSAEPRAETADAGDGTIVLAQESGTGQQASAPTLVLEKPDAGQIETVIWVPGTDRHQFQRRRRQVTVIVARPSRLARWRVLTVVGLGSARQASPGAGDAQDGAVISLDEFRWSAHGPPAGGRGGGGAGRRRCAGQPGPLAGRSQSGRHHPRPQ
jgi:hypothetical protein